MTHTCTTANRVPSIYLAISKLALIIYRLAIHLQVPIFKVFQEGFVVSVSMGPLIPGQLFYL